MSAQWEDKFEFKINNLYVSVNIGSTMYNEWDGAHFFSISQIRTDKNSHQLYNEVDEQFHSHQSNKENQEAKVRKEDSEDLLVLYKETDFLKHIMEI